MNLFDIAAALITLAALFGYLNHRFLRLEPTIGLMLIGLISSLVVIVLDQVYPELGVAAVMRGLLGNIDFNEALMHGMLGFLLFAGSLHVNLDFFSQRKWTIGSLANSASATLKITGQVLASGDYENYAQVATSDQHDPCHLYTSDSADDDTIV